MIFKSFSVVLFTLFFAINVFAQTKQNDDLKQLKADLIAKKKNLDPFANTIENTNKIDGKANIAKNEDKDNSKVDVESLGLDINTKEKQNIEKSTNKASNTNVLENTQLKSTEKSVEKAIDIINDKKTTLIKSESLDKNDNFKLDESGNIEIEINEKDAINLKSKMEDGKKSNLVEKNEIVKNFYDKANKSNIQNNEKLTQNNNTVIKNETQFEEKGVEQSQNITNSTSDLQNKNIPIEDKVAEKNIPKINKNNKIKFNKKLSEEDKILKLIEVNSSSKSNKKIKSNNKNSEEENMDELRQKYIYDDKNLHDKYFDDNVDNLNRTIDNFTNYEIPPEPLLDNYRTKNNLHIPLIISPLDKIAIVFNSMDDKSLFESAYRNVNVPNARNMKGDTILTYAILYQKHSIIASILSKGADPDLANNLGYTPLNIAIELEDFKSVKLLVDNNADINTKDANGSTYLMQAVRVGSLEIIDYLISNNADINIVDNFGMTALSIAYKYKYDIITRYLINKGAKVFIDDKFKDDSLIKRLEGKWS